MIRRFTGRLGLLAFLVWLFWLVFVSIQLIRGAPRG